MKLIRDKGFVLRFDGGEIVVTYSLGALLEAESKYGGLSEVLNVMNTVRGAVSMLTIMINNNIKAYNDDYNGNLAPVNEDFVVNEIGLSDSFENAMGLVVSVREAFFSSCPKKK